MRIDLISGSGKRKRTRTCKLFVTMSKQTALQILVESMTTSDRSFYSKEIAIALQIEREQIQNAHLAGQNSADEVNGETEIQYYEQTYGGQDE